MSVVPTDRPPLRGQTHILILPMDKAFAACVDHASPQRPRWVAGDNAAGPQSIREPTKTKHVALHYPESARRQRRSGVVYVESVIDPTGSCCPVWELPV